MLSAIPEDGVRSEVRTTSQLNHSRLFERKAAQENDAFLEELLRTKVKLIDPGLARAQVPRSLVDEVVAELKSSEEVSELLITRRTPGPEEGTRGAFAAKREMLRMAMTSTSVDVEAAARKLVKAMGGNADRQGRVARDTRPSTAAAAMWRRTPTAEATQPRRSAASVSVVDEVMPIIQSRVRSMLVSDKKRLAELFAEYDKTDDGMLSATELKAVMDGFGIECTMKDVKDMVAMYGSSHRKDKNGEPLMSHRDFYMDLIGLPTEIGDRMGVGGTGKFAEFKLPETSELLRPDTAGLRAVKSTGEYITDKFRKRMYDVPWKLRQEFEKFDESGDGNISMTEFSRVLHDNGLALKERDERDLFRLFDKNHSGTVQFNEFVEALIGTPLRDPTMGENDFGGSVSGFSVDHLDPSLQSAFTNLKASFEDHITGPAGFKKAFKGVDKDGSGAVDKAEFAEVCKTMGMDLTQQEINSVFLLYDKDGNGLISYPEFLGCVAGVAPPPGSRNFESQALFHHRGRLAAKDEDLREKIRQRLYGNESKINKLFKSFDVNGDGKMQFDEFRRMMKDMNLTLPLADIKKLYLSMADADPNAVNLPSGVKLFAISKNAFANKIVGLKSRGSTAQGGGQPKLFNMSSRPASRAGTRSRQGTRPSTAPVNPSAPPSAGSAPMSISGSNRIAARAPAAIKV